MSVEGIPALERRFAAISGPTANKRLLGQLGLLAVANAKSILYPAHRKTGNLGRTIRLGTVTASEATILAGGKGGVGYARIVELGSRPHIIRPRNKKALAWGGRRRLSGSLRTGSKATNFATFVNHPGTKPVAYLRGGAERAIRQAGLKDKIVSAWNSAA